MSTEKVLTPETTRRIPWLTLLDYTVLIALAVASALYALHYLSHQFTVVADRPSPLLEAVKSTAKPNP